MKTLRLVCILLFITIAAFGATVDSDYAAWKTAFAAPPDDCRIMMRWWWFGPSATRAELKRELQLMKEGGIGGFEVQPVYPVALDDAAKGIRNYPYLSEEFLDALRYVSVQAKSLGLLMDLTLGSGWPYGGAQVPLSDAAGKLRIVQTPIPAGARRMALPDIGAAEKLLAVFLCRTHQSKIDGEGIRRLLDIRDGAVQIPEGLQDSHAALFFISSRTGMMVKRAAFGAEGFVLNHYDGRAVGQYLKNVGDRLLQALGPNSPHAVFCDSLEVYESDWTDDFLEEFRQRRGYDLTPHLPALAFPLGPETESLRCDWGKTLSELLTERFLAPTHAWAQKNRTLFRIQGYGIPPATVAGNAHADISEGEGSQWRTLSASRWASSANHLFGRSVTSSETWTWLHSPAFRATPLDMKAEANLHFLQGINQLIGHGWPYSAENAGYPGWRFYAAGVYNEKNPWWIVMPDMARYLQRASYMLRQGQSSNDIAIYLPVSDAYAGFLPGRVNLIEKLRDTIGPDAIAAVLDAGMNFDLFDDDVLTQNGKVEHGCLVLGRNRYRAVLLPNVDRIPPATYQLLAAFVRDGGRLIASRRQPSRAPGFMATAQEQAEIRKISQGLFASGAPRSRFIEDEKMQLSAALRDLLEPDVELSPASPEIGFVHRKAPDADIYFLANSSNTRRTAAASFRVHGLQAEWWDPMTGRITPAPMTTDGRDRTSVALDLAPYEGRFLIFSKNAAQRPVSAKPSATGSLDLSRGWRVTFGASADSRFMDSLSSWIDDDATRHFSGVAVYAKAFSIPATMLQSKEPLWLDFGSGRPLPEIPERSSGMRAWLAAPVREAAVVYVNGQRAGSLWCPPYRIDVRQWIRPGENHLRILIANTAINHMAGRSLPDYRLLHLRYGARFDPQDMDKIQPIDSGLFPPLTLHTGDGPQQSQ